MTDLEFKVPTANKARGGTYWQDLLNPLKPHPERWVVVSRTKTPKSAYSAARGLRRDYRIPEGRWEFAGRSDGNGGGEVFARYLGPEE